MKLLSNRVRKIAGLICVFATLAGGALAFWAVETQISVMGLPTDAEYERYMQYVAAYRILFGVGGAALLLWFVASRWGPREP